MEKGSCSNFEAKCLLSKIHSFSIPFYIIWKILKNPPIERPIVAGYNWILSPASIFVGYLLKQYLSLVKILEKTKCNIKCFPFTVDFESLYTNILVLDAIELMKKLVSNFKMSFSMHILQ